MPAKFSLGQIVMTTGALALEQSLLAHNGTSLVHFLSRHQAGEWGELDPADASQNDQALKNGTRILSAYSTPAGRLWIMTEADRSATLLLVPSEYLVTHGPLEEVEA